MAAIGNLWFFLLSHLLRNYGVDSNLPIRLTSMSSCASTKPNSGRSINFTFLAPSSDLVTEVKDSHLFVTTVKNSHEFFTGVTNTFDFSHLWQIRLTFTFERICHTCEEFAHVKNSNEFFTCLTNTSSSNFSHVWQIRSIFHTCDRFVWLSHSNESVTTCEEFARICHIRTNSSHVWQISANSSHV